MPTLRHPRALDDVAGHPPRTIPSAAVGERVTVDDAGTFTIDDAADARDLAAAYEVDLERLVVDDDTDGLTVAEMIEAGVCPWCESDPYEGDHVGQHASSAHPDEWDAFHPEE